MRPMQKSPPLPEFQRYQIAFTAHIRDPKAQPRPAGVEARRMKIYTELLYNNLEGFLLACFPVLRKVLGTRKWAALVRDFFRTHRSHTPYFRQIPDEFIQFLQNEWTPPGGYPPFTLALAHYEWIELVLSVSNRSVDCAVDAAGDLLDGVPLLNPVLANLRYDWPVHRIAPRRKMQPAETHLLVFRDAADQVQFIEINAFTARLLTLLEPGKLSGHAALQQVADESRHPDRALLVQAGSALLNDLRARGAILGSAA
ncbi:MAG: putative DNA-binding domain-containing protein [Thiobacillus sp.]|nr:putative DNA-binding domain-containing protein [Thiobacillus sp.]MDP3124814.1 putative DNA-binding domain-containing protein [Thiobacillus sp.]